MSVDRLTEINEIGFRGTTVITDTAVHQGRWKKVVPYEATVFTTLEDDKIEGSIASESFPANFEFLGDFTTITLASGAVVAYK